MPQKAYPEINKKTEKKEEQNQMVVYL